MITSLKQFIVACLAEIADPYDLFESFCDDNTRDFIYSLADPESPELFRSAMHRIGFTEY